MPNSSIDAHLKCIRRFMISSEWNWDVRGADRIATTAEHFWFTLSFTSCECFSADVTLAPKLKNEGHYV